MARGQKGDTLFSMLSLSSELGKQVWLCLLVIASFTALCCFLWYLLEDNIVDDQSFLLEANSIQVSSLPKHIPNQVLNDLVQDERIKLPLDIREKNLSEFISDTFEAHPWVKQVTKVSKQYPAQLMIELEYRVPVAMVEVIDQGKRGLLPVDQFGVLLPPNDFSKSQAATYPRINIGEISTASNLGQHWGDVRVEEAASIAAKLKDYWKLLNLHRIVAVDNKGHTQFELQTKSQQVIIWGSAPGKELPQESISDQKVSFLDHSLSTIAQNKKFSLDLRTITRVSVQRNISEPK